MDRHTDREKHKGKTVYPSLFWSRGVILKTCVLDYSYLAIIFLLRNIHFFKLLYYCAVDNIFKPAIFFEYLLDEVMNQIKNRIIYETDYMLFDAELTKTLPST